MAIKATVSFKTIQATVSHRKLSLDASLVPELGNQISFSKLTAVANWKNLYLHDVHVNAERTIYTFNDQYSLADSAVGICDSVIVSGSSEVVSPSEGDGEGDTGGGGGGGS